MSQANDGPDRGSTYSTPRWVKVIGIIALVLVLLIGIMLLAGGEHGPGRHQASVDSGGETPPSSVTEDHTPSGGDQGSHTPPIDHSG